MKPFIFRARNFIFRKVLLSHDKRIVLKPKAFVLTLLIGLTAVYSLVKLTKRTSMKKVFEYDLMLDIMNSQNISNRKIMCPAKRLNDSFNQNQKFIEKYYLSLNALNKRESNAEKLFSISSYSLKLEDTRKPEE